MLEENHYYPFGLAMAGISDKALKLNYTENKYRYNGGTELQNKEFSDGSGLELYDANARMYDPQIGRFGGIDALSSTTSGLSPYQFAYNDPTLFNDPGGMKTALPSLNDIINTLWNSQYGGEWSSGSPGTAFDFGDEGTEDFFGGLAANGNSSFFDNLADSYSFIQAQASGGNQILDFDISQGKSGTYYATSAYYSTTQGKGATMMKELGTLSFAENGLSYDWGDDGNTGGSSQSTNGWGTGFEITKVAGNALDLTQASTVWSQQLANKVAKTNYVVKDIVKDSRVLSGIGNVLGIASIIDHGSKFLDDPSGNWVDGVEAVGQGLVMAFGGEEVEIGWNVGSMILDWGREAIEDN